AYRARSIRHSNDVRPSFVVDGEIFWGNDRLHFLKAYLQGSLPNRPLRNSPSCRRGGLIVAPHPVTRGKLTIDLAAHHRLPAIYPFAFHAREGGLLAYGIDQVDQWRNAATYVDRILRGTKPADLPVEQPTKFELAINLKTAKALGLTILVTQIACVPGNADRLRRRSN